MPNPLIDQGVVNRLRGSLVLPDNPSLNITAPYLGRAGIRLALQGQATVYLPTLTGAVRSPEPYMMIQLSANLLKSQPLCDAYKRRMETDSALGNGTVRTDSSTLSVYELINLSVAEVRELSFTGEDADFIITIIGYYSTNSSLFG
jgi:hypothetical protein